MRGERWAVTAIGAVTGVCFAALAARALSITFVSRNQLHVSSPVFAAIAVVLSYLAFRAATSGRTDQASVLRALWGGLGGALVGLLIVAVGYLMFRDAIRPYFAHSFGFRTSQVGLGLLLAASLFLGFGAGFVLRLQRSR